MFFHHQYLGGCHLRGFEAVALLARQVRKPLFTLSNINHPDGVINGLSLLSFALFFQSLDWPNSDADMSVRWGLQAGEASLRLQTSL